MRRSKRDEIILSYKDVVLRQSDLDILRGPHYINDRIIEFYFSYLSSCHPSQEILLTSPSIAFWALKCPLIESLRDVLEPLHLSEKQLVIFPVNDNEEIGRAEGGSHWSLLLFYRKANVFVHHDSSGVMNEWHAKQLYSTLVPFVAGPCSTSDMSFVEYAGTPLQQNGYDCGLYVLAITRAICSWYEQGQDGSWFPSVEEQVSPSNVAAMRNEILQLIESLNSNKDSQKDDKS